MKIVIIEDEKLTANHLAKTIIFIQEEAQIVSILTSVEDGIEYFKNQPKIDLIFSDIELGDGLSFEIFEQVQVQVPIIFCTAYSQYALDAFKTTGIDYLLKPFDNNSIEKALQKYNLLKVNSESQTQNLESLMNLFSKNNSSNNKKSILIHQGDKIIPINISEIALFYIEDAYTFAYTFNGQKHILNQNLDVLEKNFLTFFRANRQFLISREAVKDASQYFHRKILINLKFSFSEQIIVGKLKVTAFLEWLVSK